MRSFACIAIATSVIPTYNLQVALFAAAAVQRKHCVVSPCWMKKNGVDKMRQVGTAPAAGMTVCCLSGLWCGVMHKCL